MINVSGTTSHKHDMPLTKITTIHLFWKTEKASLFFVHNKFCIYQCNKKYSRNKKTGQFFDKSFSTKNTSLLELVLTEPAPGYNFTHVNISVDVVLSEKLCYLVVVFISREHSKAGMDTGSRKLRRACRSVEMPGAHTGTPWIPRPNASQQLLTDRRWMRVGCELSSGANRFGKAFTSCCRTEGITFRFSSKKEDWKEKQKSGQWRYAVDTTTKCIKTIVYWQAGWWGSSVNFFGGQITFENHSHISVVPGGWTSDFFSKKRKL